MDSLAASAPPELPTGAASQHHSSAAPAGRSSGAAPQVADDVLRQGVRGITDIITVPGLVLTAAPPRASSHRCWCSFTATAAAACVASPARHACPARHPSRHCRRRRSTCPRSRAACSSGPSRSHLVFAQVNVDFADVRAVMSNAGSSLMGLGKASGRGAQPSMCHQRPRIPPTAGFRSLAAGIAPLGSHTLGPQPRPPPAIVQWAAGPGLSALYRCQGARVKLRSLRSAHLCWTWASSAPQELCGTLQARAPH